MKPWEATELNFDASTFSGVVRLFPLPNLVLYPHVMQPLHIFEERYREMLEDALAGDQLITMAVLEPGWETDYDSRPPVSEFACLGKVVAHHRLEDGRSNVLLLGVQRVQIVKELDPLRSFRQARVELVEDCYDFGSSLRTQTGAGRTADGIPQPPAMLMRTARAAGEHALRPIAARPAHRSGSLRVPAPCRRETAAAKRMLRA